jgi:hypothetical protein
MEFDAEGNILPITPTHQKPAIGAKAPKNLAFGAAVTASSCYSDWFKPEYAVDDNNGTLWRPKGMGEEWLKIDLGKVLKIQTIWTQWEYGTQYYQYRIETSSDGKHWQLFADRSRNLHAGSPKIDVAPMVKGRNMPVKARYVKITFLGCQKQGYPGALWNVKVFNTREDKDNFEWPAPKVLGESGDELIHITADDFQVGDTIWYIPNHGVVSGGFEHEDGLMVVQDVEGTKALPFDSATIFASDFPMPELWRDNVPYHLEATLYNPTIQLPWAMPMFVAALLTGGPLYMGVVLICMAVSAVLYYPFFKIADKQAYEEEQALAAEQAQQ